MRNCPLDNDFNSRTSCEVRHIRQIVSIGYMNFNSRTSCEVRPILVGYRRDVGQFQLTHLLRGAT